jgi:parallel beta-helix repeat protein
MDGRNRRLVRCLSLASVVAAALMVAPTGASATHVQCGDHITQNTRLDSDLTNCLSVGVFISAHNVTLDLAGHTIDGYTSSIFTERDGVHTDGFDGLQVKNGVIQQFDAGVSFALGVTDSRVTGLFLTENGDGVSINDSDGNKIERNTATNSTQGIVVNPNSENNQIVRNTLSGNGFAGISIAGDNNQLIANDSSRNDYGIYLPGGSGNTVRRNVTSMNGQFGGDGIFVGAATLNTLLEGNVANQNVLDDGIDVEQALTTLTRNTANFNGDWGIEAVPGVTDGGRNKATGNNGGGTGGQCLNVSCGS